VVSAELLAGSAQPKSKTILNFIRKSKSGNRQSPIAGAILTSADVDCIVGLLHLREQQPLELYSTAAVRKIIRQGNSLFRMLEQKPDQCTWNEIAPSTEDVYWWNGFDGNRNRWGLPILRTEWKPE